MQELLLLKFRNGCLDVLQNEIFVGNCLSQTLIGQNYETVHIRALITLQSRVAPGVRLVPLS